MEHANYDAARVYSDLSGLGALKRDARDNDPAALKEVAKQFESLFIDLVVKSMRDANRVFSEGNMFDSEQVRFYEDMYDDQLALTMTEGRGIGLAEVLAKQLGSAFQQEDIHKDRVRSENSQNHSVQYNKFQNQNVENNHIGISDVEKNVQRLAKYVEVAKESASGADVKVTSETFKSADDFIETLYPAARAASQRIGLDPKILLAQAALETGWGQHIPQHEGASSHNLFGIKASANWQGKKVLTDTTEYRGDKAVNERAYFRAYDSFTESFEDYIDLISQNTRYQPALDHVSNGRAYIHELQRAGYATDPAYGDKVSRIFESERMNLREPNRI